MKTIFLAATILASSATNADELIQFNNGATAFRTESGYTYGYSGGVQTKDSGFNDMRNGQRYERIGRTLSLDTRTGRTFFTPDEELQDQNGEE